MFQPIFPINQSVVGDFGIHTYQIKEMEHDGHQNSPAPKRMAVTSNQLV